MRFKYAAGILEIIGVTSAAAKEFRPTITAFFLFINVGRCKIALNLAVKRSVLDRAHYIIGHADKLVTRINVTVRSYRNILVAAAASAKPFNRARTAVKIDHKMEEIDLRPLLFKLDYLVGQTVIFRGDRSLLSNNQAFRR